MLYRDQHEPRHECAPGRGAAGARGPQRGAQASGYPREERKCRRRERGCPRPALEQVRVRPQRGDDALS